MTILLGDPRVAAVAVHETYQPLVTLGASFGSARARVRAGVAKRLRRAQVALPVGVSLRVVEGHRSAAAQASLIAEYSAQVRRLYPDTGREERDRLVGRHMAPLPVAPHVAGAAVDVTLADLWGAELDLGTSIDATPEESGGRCGLDAADIPSSARQHRAVLAAALSGAGLVNYPSQWWHWSYGDRYWALLTGAPAALYGPVTDLDQPDEARRVGWRVAA